MKSRLVAGVVAAVLALVGILLIFVYVQNADRRAMENLEPVEVLVVQEAVPAGTPVEALAESVVIETLPQKAVPKDALQSLEKASGKVTATALVPGEQLLGKRLVDPENVEKTGSVPIPKGMQEVSFTVSDPQRIVGGQVAAGDTVGFFVSFEAGALEDEPELETTQRVFHKLLVTKIQTAPAAEGATPDPNAFPAGPRLVTVAVDDADATKIVFAAEFGRVWLTNEPADAKEAPPTLIRKSDVYP